MANVSSEILLTHPLLLENPITQDSANWAVEILTHPSLTKELLSQGIRSKDISVVA